MKLKIIERKNESNIWTQIEYKIKKYRGGYKKIQQKNKRVE
jgi:hypothetical protein